MNDSKPKMLRSPEKIGYKEFSDMVDDLPNGMIKAMICVAYASGARVSELNRILSSDIWVEGDYLIIRCRVLKKRSNKPEFRLVPVRLDESWLTTPIINYKNAIPSDSRLFDYHRATIYKKVWAAININPHGFRKLRLTHLATRYKFTDQQLTKFAGWADSTPAKAYVKLNLDDIKY